MRIAGSNLHKLPYIVVREFRVRPGRRRAFEKAYGPCGDWLRLFQRKPGHIRSELVPDRERPLRYLTLDFWTSRKSYEHFMTQDQAEYQRIHQRCSRLTVSETLIGEFDDLALGPAGQDLPGPLAIRAASNGDISGMIEVAREISTCAQWPHSVYEKIFDANPLHRLAFVLARQNCAVEGFIVASLGGETCEVENLVVASTLAGQGWGKRLFDQLIDAARARQATEIFLEVRESAQPARRLYERCGLMPAGRRKNYYRNPCEDALLYRRKL